MLKALIVAFMVSLSAYHGVYAIPHDTSMAVVMCEYGTVAPGEGV